MEHIRYAFKARFLFAKRVRVMALVILPFAAAANAHATSTYLILPTGNFECTTNAGDCSGVSGDSQLPNVGGLAGVSFFTQPGDEISIPVSGLQVALVLNASGPLNQTLSGNVPVSWDFTLSTTGVPIDFWSVMFELGTTSGDSTYGSFRSFSDGPFSLPEEFTGSGNITVLGSPSSTIWETVALVISPTGSGTVDITAPFDLGSGVPEPATVGTLGAGLGILVWLVRRRRT